MKRDFREDSTSSQLQNSATLELFCEFSRSRAAKNRVDRLAWQLLRV
jgi:hypothetical protein